MLRRMARCVNRLDANLADHKPIAVFEKMGVRSPPWPPVSPIRSTHGGKVEVNVTILGELSRPTDKVSMDMRLRDCANPQPIVLGNFSIAVDVAFRIDDESAFRLLAAHEIGVMSKLGIKDLSEEHERKHSPELAP